MQSIKFRAKTLDGELIYSSLGELIYSSLYEVTNFFPADGVFYVGGVPCKVGSEQEYTGLHDKNGMEIYEGDLIKDTDSDYIGEVLFDTETLCFTTKFQDNSLWGFVPRQGKDNHCEVIGNIYENPELLKENSNG